MRKRIFSAYNSRICDRPVPSAVVLVARPGNVVYFQSFGKMSVDDEKPMSPDAIFRIYSMAKPITLPPEALPMAVMGAPLPGAGFGLGVSVLDSADAKAQPPAAGEYGWSGAHSTNFWVAPKSELFAIVMQQLEPFSFELPLALKPVIYAAIED